MKTDITTLPGYKLCEYLVVLSPHEDLCNRIMKIKSDFADKYQAPAAQFGKPQISLVKFSQLQLMEERIVNRLRMIAMAVPAFKIELKDFSSFPSHTIYINVESKGSIQMLSKSLKPAQRLMTSKEFKPHFMDNPYFTIARQLLPWQYEKGWLEYSHKHFTGKFIAEDMLLLRRPEGVKSYQLVQRFEFLNMPVLTTQGSLF